MFGGFFSQFSAIEIINFNEKFFRPYWRYQLLEINCKKIFCLRSFLQNDGRLKIENSHFYHTMD